MAQEPDVIAELRQDLGQRLVDNHLAAGGRLVAAFVALQAAVRRHETHARDAETAALHDHVDSWNSSSSQVRGSAERAVLIAVAAEQAVLLT